MRVLVTGGAGFIGSWLVDRLVAAGHDVDVLDDLSSGSHANLDAARGSGRVGLEVMDVRSDEVGHYMGTRRPEVVFHLAAQVSVARSVDAPSIDAEVNLLGSLRVLDAAVACGARRVVIATSAAIYGEVEPAQLPVSEARALRPTSPYGISKMALLPYLEFYGRHHGISSCALCLANVYGPRQTREGETSVVAAFAKTLDAGRPATIYGDGHQTRDFVFVDDVAEAFVLAGSSSATGLVNIGTGEQTSIARLYDEMAALRGVVAPPSFAPARPAEVRASALDPTRARQLFGWEASTALRDGLAAVLEAPLHSN